MTEPLPQAGSAALAIAWIRLAAATIHDRRMWLTELDAAIGDGDHGINLDRGLAAVVASLDADDDTATDGASILVLAGRRLLGMVGGASGALYGRGLMTAGERLHACRDDPTLSGRGRLGVALAGAIEGITALGRAVPGDKTMLDALLPAFAALGEAPRDASVAEVIARAAAAAERGAAATMDLVARKGRASYLGERSIGHVDPGAASSAILLRCLAEAAAGQERGGAE